jgi:hypothetical protein
MAQVMSPTQQAALALSVTLGSGRMFAEPGLLLADGGVRFEANTRPPSGSVTDDRAEVMAADSANCAAEEQHEIQLSAEGSAIDTVAVASYYRLCMRSRGW